jgi:phosphomethylpyrimidine synthase
MCGPKFCLMELTRQVRTLDENERGMQEKSVEFRARGGALYVSSDEGTAVPPDGAAGALPPGAHV